MAIYNVSIPNILCDQVTAVQSAMPPRQGVGHNRVPIISQGGLVKNQGSEVRPADEQFVERMLEDDDLSQQAVILDYCKQESQGQVDQNNQSFHECFASQLDINREEEKLLSKIRHGQSDEELAREYQKKLFEEDFGVTEQQSEEILRALHGMTDSDLIEKIKKFALNPDTIPSAPPRPIRPNDGDSGETGRKRNVDLASDDECRKRRRSVEEESQLEAAVPPPSAQNSGGIALAKDRDEFYKKLREDFLTARNRQEEIARLKKDSHQRELEQGEDVPDTKPSPISQEMEKYRERRKEDEKERRARRDEKIKQRDLEQDEKTKEISLIDQFTRAIKPNKKDEIQQLFIDRKNAEKKRERLARRDEKIEQRKLEQGNINKTPSSIERFRTAMKPNEKNEVQTLFDDRRKKHQQIEKQQLIDQKEVMTKKIEGDKRAIEIGKEVKARQVERKLEQAQKKAEQAKLEEQATRKMVRFYRDQNIEREARAIGMTKEEYVMREAGQK